MTGAATSALSQDEAFARIRLLRSPNFGPVSYAMLLQRFGSAVKALEALPDLGRRGGRAYRAIAAETVEREVEAVRQAGAKYLFHDQPDYPALLGQLDSAPPILTWRGDLALAARPCVAMVGARNASAAAVKLARDFASGLAEAGFSNMQLPIRKHLSALTLSHQALSWILDVQLSASSLRTRTSSLVEGVASSSRLTCLVPWRGKERTLGRRLAAQCSMTLILASH